jgi:Lysophospholipase L1 and related esterases
MKTCFLFLALTCTYFYSGAQADTSYLNNIKAELVKKWPKNRTINLVFHGHSVPTGYFRTPDVRTLDAYPHQVLKDLKALYPYAVINSITTSIGGENSVQGAKRFKKDVLIHRPDVLFIDYALNDRGLVPKDSIASLKKAYEATEKMVKAALKQHIKVILLTPSPDTRENILQANALLQLYANQLTALAKKYNIGLVDSYAAFKKQVSEGRSLNELMAQVNHPNEKGHALIAQAIVAWFR